jgi:subtilase family serine protease
MKEPPSRGKVLEGLSDSRHQAAERLIVERMNRHPSGRTAKPNGHITQVSCRRRLMMASSLLLHLSWTLSGRCSGTFAQMGFLGLALLMPGALSAQQPDLVVQSVDVNGTSISAGGSVTVTVTVRNQGSGSAGPTTTMVRLSTNPNSSSTSDPQNGVSTGSISAGSVRTVTATITVNTPGMYYAHVYVDNFSVLSQSSTSNDIHHHPGGIIVTAAPQPDLVVESVALNTPSISVGQSVRVTVRVRNQGSGDAAASTTMVRLSANPNSSSTSDPQQGVPTGSISDGSTRTVTATITVDTPATYYAHVYVDNFSVLNQSSTSNDTYHHPEAIIVTAAPQPDLIVESVTLNTTTISVGQDVRVSVTLRNQGSGDAAATTTMVRLSANPNSSNSSDPQDGVSTRSISDGSTRLVTATITVNVPGTYYAHVYVDNFSVLSQSGTSNDSYHHPEAIIVTAGPQPDLMVESVTLNTTTIIVGQNVRVSVKVRNQGSGDAAATTTMVRLSSNPNASSPSDPQQVVSTSSISDGAARTVTATIAVDTPGTYYAHVYVDNLSALSQSSTSNDIYHHPEAITVTAGGQPDLIVESVSLNTTTISVGDNVRVTVRVRNQGNGDAAATTTMVRLSTNPNSSSTSDPQQGVSTGLISDGSSRTVTATITVNAPGTYYAHVYLDNLSALNQSSTSNDIYHHPQSIIVTSAPQPDLMVDSVALNATSITVGQSVRVSVRVRNQGGGNASATTTMVRLSTNPKSSSTSDPQEGVPTGSISDGSTRLVTATITLNTPGTYYAHVYVDNLGVLNQSSTSNDIYHHPEAITVTTAPQPDLIVERVTLNTTSITVGESLRVTVRVRNQGTGDAAATTTMIRLSTNPNSSSTSDPQEGVPTGLISDGSTRLVTATITVDTPGTFYAHVYVDNSNVLSQSNTSNDIYHHPESIIVTAGGQPDLVVESVTLNTTSISVGERVQVTVRVRNQGGGDAAATTTMVRLSTNPTSSSTSDPQDGVATRAIFDGNLRTVTATITVDTPGTYYAHVYVDNSNVLSQSSTSNDIYHHRDAITVTATRQPDLVVERLTLNTTSISVGEIVRVTVRVRNQGSGDAAATTTMVRLSANPNSSTTSDPQDGVATSPISDGSTRTVTATITVGTPGTYYAHVYLDNFSTLKQSSTSNDIRHHPEAIIVTAAPQPDLVVESVTLNATHFSVGESVRVTVRVRNQGSGDAAATTTMVRLSTNPTSSSTSDPQHDVPTGSVIDGNTRTVRAMITVDAPGTYYAHVYLDNSNALSQSSTANDVHHHPQAIIVAGEEASGALWTVLAPVEGAFRVTVRDDQCYNSTIPEEWTFCQHQTDLHQPGRGLAGADETLAWDMNLLGDADAGRPVYAVAMGTVVMYGGTYGAGERSGSVLIEHSSGGRTWWTGYLHMNNIRVEVGQAVSPTTELGSISNVSDGRAVPTHLHFVVYEGSNEPGGLRSRDVQFIQRSANMGATADPR